MKEIKEITVYTSGDSEDITTWSNIPYFFTKTLLEKGIKINRVDIGPSTFLNAFYNLTCWNIIKIINKKTTYTYFRTLINFIDTRFKIRKAIKEYPNADLNVFLTFSFSAAGLTDKPSILICDWTYEHYFNYFEKRNPDWLERASIRRENDMIERSELIFPLFPGITENMLSRFKNKNIYYLGYIINSMNEMAEPEIIQLKKNSYDLLFVGDKKYLEGANNLAEAFSKLRSEIPELLLHIVGLGEKDLNRHHEGVYCYGYLNKSIDSDREIYYFLFRRARIFINTTNKWGAFSATIEAMYFYTPVIVSPYEEFIRSFGKEIKFGRYCESNDPAIIQERIKEILNHESFSDLCLNSHEAVRSFTWADYTDRMMEKIIQLGTM